jgi:TonB family protein
MPALMCLVFCCAAPCLAQSQQPLYPRHIETPHFPPAARAANVTGSVSLNVTIDADGHVIKVEATTGPKMLQTAAAENLQHWTFAKPQTAPYEETITYDYEFDASLPGNDGYTAITNVNFDLPDRVTILANERLIDHT